MVAALQSTVGKANFFLVQCLILSPTLYMSYSAIKLVEILVVGNIRDIG